MSQLGNRGADDDERRLQQIRCLDQREQRSIGSEVGDPPAVSAEREPEADQPEIVLISGNAREQCVRTATAPPVARQGEQTAAQQRAGEVLLRDRCLSVRPALAELVEVGKDRVPQDALERVGTQEPVEYGVRADVVESVERMAQLLAERSCRRCPASVICSGGGVKSRRRVSSCEPSRLGCR